MIAKIIDLIREYSEGVFFYIWSTSGRYLQHTSVQWHHIHVRLRFKVYCYFWKETTYSKNLKTTVVLQEALKADSPASNSTPCSRVDILNALYWCTQVTCAACRLEAVVVRHIEIVLESSERLKSGSIYKSVSLNIMSQTKQLDILKVTFERK